MQRKLQRDSLQTIHWHCHVFILHSTYMSSSKVVKKHTHGAISTDLLFARERQHDDYFCLCCTTEHMLYLVEQCAHINDGGI